MTDQTNQNPLNPNQSTPNNISQPSQDHIDLGNIFGDDDFTQSPLSQHTNTPQPIVQSNTVIPTPTPNIQTTPVTDIQPTVIPSISTQIETTPTIQQPIAVPPSTPQAPVATVDLQTPVQSTTPISVTAPVTTPQIPVQPATVQATIQQPIPTSIPQTVMTPTTQQSVVTQPSTPIQQTTSQPVVPVVPTIQPTPAIIPPVITVKKGSKVSPITFFIGCGLFGFLIIGIISVTLYFAIQNPSKFQGIIGIEGIKSGLKLFTGLFFGILFLGGFVGSIFNLYKIITTKVGSKIKYIIGIILSIVLLGGSVLGGMTSFKKINEIIGTTGDQNSLLIPSIQFKDKERPISEGYPIIAPTKISYGVNAILLDRFITTNFPNKIVNTLLLDCGNETQQLPYNANAKQFEGKCLYMKKGDYIISLVSNTTDTATKITKDETTVLGPLSVVSEITFTPSDESPLQFNDAKDEVIIGKAPTKLNFQSDKLFSDLKLDQYNIQRDLDNDGIFDKTNVTNFARQFRVPQVQKVNYTLPDLQAPYNTLIYEFDFRVLQNDVPICTITANAGNKTNLYTIQASFDTDEPAITSYLYKIKNLATNKFITAPVNKKDTFDYEFPTKGAYVIYLEYITEDGKPGKCESDTIDVGSSDFSVNYTTQYKGPNDTQRQNFAGQSSGAQLVMNTNGITARVLPARIQITLNSISPQSTTLKKEVKLDDQIIQTPDGKTYEITLQNATHKQITITISDSKTKAESTITIPLTIIQKDILGELKVFPDTVGTSPFEVTLDASTTTITDKDDEIIYFSWDFGDGKKVANSSQARTAHTYIYDETNQNGSYTPSVTITTKKGKKATLNLATPLLVKKPNLVSKIIVESHPAQIASVGDKVEFALQTDGNPSHISWDFGTVDGIECDDRSCATVPMFFNTAGTYTIKATTTYKDLTTSIATTKVIIEDK